MLTKYLNFKAISTKLKEILHKQSKFGNIMTPRDLEI